MNLKAYLKPMINLKYFIIILILAIAFIKPVGRMLYPVCYTDIIDSAANKYKLSPHLVMAVISKESKFQKDALSHRGAKGLMQIRDKTAKWCMEEFKIDGDDIYDERVNINVGCAYLRYLLDKFYDDTNLALAAYNAGEGNVRSWIRNTKGELKISDIPFKETKEYVKKVSKRRRIYKFLY